VPGRAGLVYACSGALQADRLLLLVLLALVLVLPIRCSVLGILLALTISDVCVCVCVRVLRLARVHIVGIGDDTRRQVVAFCEKRCSRRNRCSISCCISISGELRLSARRGVLVR